MKMPGVIKKHPVAFGIGAIVIVVGFIMLSGSGGETQVVSGGPSEAEIAAGMQMQQLQASQQAMAFQVGAEREVALANMGAQLELGKLQIAQQGRSDELAAAMGMAQINATQQTTALTSTLSAQTEQARIAADTAQNAAMLSTITRQSELQAQTAMNAINAQVSIAQINKPKRGLFSKIFG